MTSQPYPHEIFLDGFRFMDTDTLLQFNNSLREEFSNIPYPLGQSLDPKGRHVVVKFQALSDRVERVQVKCKLRGRSEPFEIVLYGRRGFIEGLPQYRPTHQRVVVPYNQNPLKDIMFPQGYQTAPSRILKEDCD